MLLCLMAVGVMHYRGAVLSPGRSLHNTVVESLDTANTAETMKRRPPLPLRPCPTSMMVDDSPIAIAQRMAFPIRRPPRRRHRQNGLGNPPTIRRTSIDKFKGCFP